MRPRSSLPSWGGCRAGRAGSSSGCSRWPYPGRAPGNPGSSQPRASGAPWPGPTGPSAPAACGRSTSRPGPRAGIRSQESGVRGLRRIRMATVQTHQDLQVWQKSMDLVVEVYRVAKGLPKVEQFGLVSQMQRAAVSIPANIAEGHGRSATGAYCNHLSIAHGSLMELDTHLMIAERLEYLEPEALQPLLARTREIGRMLHGLMRALRSRESGVGSQGTTGTRSP
ncbi:MAG: four helix bundle protein [Thermodesulfobacteriota bacterium]